MNVLYIQRQPDFPVVSHSHLIDVYNSYSAQSGQQLPVAQ
jgi:hypothetical protein